MPVSSFPITQDVAATLQQFAVFTFGGRSYQGVILNDPDTGVAAQVNADGSLVIQISDGTDTALVDGTGHLLVAGSFTAAKGAKTFSANAPTVAAALALAANASRVTALIQNTGAVDVWLGKDGTLTTANGFFLRAGDTYSDGDSTDAWWAITAGAVAALRIIEVA